MCGIVAYVGQQEAYPILIEGLKRLEYRGYDSAGVALLNEADELNVYKTIGKVSDLEAFAASKDVSGHIGIAHTRWATHGEPSQVNAHPHRSQSGNIALIHNGIIENYLSLRKELEKRGFKFQSSTDTEVLTNLIEDVQLSEHVDLFEAVRIALNHVVGAYAIANARREFNETARDYNTTVRRFPGNIIAGMFGFDKKPYFEASEGADKAPDVKDLFQ